MSFFLEVLIEFFKLKRAELRDIGYRFWCGLIKFKWLLVLGQTILIAVCAAVAVSLIAGIIGWLTSVILPSLFAAMAGTATGLNMYLTVGFPLMMLLATALVFGWIIFTPFFEWIGNNWRTATDHIKQKHKEPS